VAADSTRTGPVSFEPIGVLRSPFVERADAPRQASVAHEVEGRVELYPGRGLEDALEDLELWDYLWLIVWFHKNEGFRPKVQPPRSDKKRGVLATRSPYRPNPIGLSAVKLVRVEGLSVWVRGLDLLDGTPVLDIKPYVPYADAIPQAGHGWLEAGPSVEGQALDPLPAYRVRADAHAQAQLDYLATEHDLTLWPRIVSALSLGPKPHAYRRIKQEGEGFVLAVKDWRVRFTVEGREVTVHGLFTGYKPRELWSANSEAPASHRAFCERFGLR
jgi:tRNA-Thr(GGU) m(6)t(6)A37 methyltransferase TsaA